MEKEQNPLDEQQRRPWLSVIGLVLALLVWISIPLYPTAESTTTLYVYLYISIALAIASFVMSLVGRHQAPMLAKVGMVVAGALFLFLIIPLVVNICV